MFSEHDIESMNFKRVMWAMHIVTKIHDNNNVEVLYPYEWKLLLDRYRWFRSKGYADWREEKPNGL
jgi:nuclear transport factor 2 (NTF2) superfamily protein